jgi:hypothetical protein
VTPLEEYLGHLLVQKLEWKGFRAVLNPNRAGTRPLFGCPAL